MKKEFEAAQMKVVLLSRSITTFNLRGLFGEEREPIEIEEEEKPPVPLVSGD